MTSGQRVVVIGGSGPSLRAADLARVPASSAITRINNFFLEPEYYLGTRVDYAYFSADPRAVRFYLATLRRVIAQGEYDVRASASHLPTAAFHRPPQPFVSTATWPQEVDDLLGGIRANEGMRPTSGAMAMLYAYVNGATRLLLAGIDLYGGAKYAFDLPPRLAQVLRPNLNTSGYDRRIHTRSADLQVMSWLREKGVSLERISTDPIEGLDTQLAPVLPQEQQLPPRIAKARPYTDDWVPRDGLRTVAGLAIARSIRRRLPQGRLSQASRRDVA